MRKLVIVGVVFALCAWAAGAAFASGIDNKTNWSAGYARTMNRNAVYDAPDAAVYNPAGIGRMETGLYVSANNQSLFINYSHESAADLYEAKNPTIFLPSAFVVYKPGKLGFYGAFYVPAGGGSLKYKDGVADLNEGIPALLLPALDSFGPSAELFGVYYAGTAGVVYALNDMISFSVGGRYISANQKTKLETDDPVPALGGVTLLLDYKAKATGFGGIFGVNVSPLSGMNIGVRYETKTKLEWEYSDVDGALASGFGVVDGDKFDRDLPAILGVGVSYMVLPKLKVEGSFDHYCQKKADWDGEEDDLKNGFAMGVMAEYQATEKLLASAGFLYTKTGDGPDTLFFLNPALDSFTVAGGALYRITDDLTVELGVIKPFYQEQDGVSDGETDVTLDKSLWIVALGVSYKIF